MPVEQAARRALTLASRTALAILRDREEAQEVAQEVAVLACGRLHQLRDERAFDAWVHRIAVRESLRAVKRTQTARRRLVSLDATSADVEAVSSVALAGSESPMLDAVADLPERERAAVILRYVHDLPDEQIAAVLRCRTGTVRSLLSRARARLRESTRPKIAPEIELNGANA